MSGSYRRMDDPSVESFAVRVVLLGASNLVRGLASAVVTAHRAVGGGRLDVYVAHGHGRSYGQRSRVLGRTLPGILDCGIWEALERDAATPLRALLTDVGNDIGYGVDAGTLTGWVDACTERLAAAGDVRLVVTPPPRANIERLRDVEIALAKRFFFPTSPVSTADVRREVADLDRRLREVAARRGAALVEPEASWYGLDPIHVRRSLYPRAWAAMLAPWSDAPVLPAPASVTRQLRLWWQFPERWWLFGVALGSRQPAVVLPEGVRVFFY